MATRRDYGENEHDLKKQWPSCVGESMDPMNNMSRSVLVKKLRRYKSMDLECKQAKKESSNFSLLTDRLSESLDVLTNKKEQSNHSQKRKIGLDFALSTTRLEYASPISRQYLLTRPSIHSKLKHEQVPSHFVTTNEILKSNGFHQHVDKQKLFQDTSQFNTKEFYFNTSLNNAPFFVLSAGGVFFTVVVYLYLYFSYNTYVFSDKRDNFLLCPKMWTGEHNTCFSKASLEKVQGVVAMIMRQSSVLAGEEKCGEREEGTMPVEEVEEVVEGSDIFIETSTLLNLFQKNSHWSVKLLDSNGQEVVDVSKARLLRSTKYILSWSCRISTLASDCIYVCIVFIVIIVTLLSAKSLHSYLEWRGEVENVELNSLMERVVDTLKTQATMSSYSLDASIDPWLSEEFICNSVHQPNTLSNGKQLWKRALKILRQNESRLAFKNEVVNGKGWIFKNIKFIIIHLFIQ